MKLKVEAVATGDPNVTAYRSTVTEEPAEAGEAKLTGIGLRVFEELEKGG